MTNRFTIMKGHRTMKKYLGSIAPQLVIALTLALCAYLGVVDPASAALAGAALTTTTAQLGNGAILQISAGSPTAFITINNVTDVSFNNGSSAEVDVTALTSSWREFLLGLPDPGSLTATVHTDMGDAGQAAAYAAKNARTKCDIKVILASGTTPNWTALGWVKKFDFTLGVDAPVKTALEIRITGPWTAS